MKEDASFANVIGSHYKNIDFVQITLLDMVLLLSVQLQNV